MSWFDEGTRTNAVDVAKVMDSGAPGILWAIAESGALVSLGVTSDGGALGVTITMDGRWRREYFRDSDELVDWLLGAQEAVRQEAERLAASPGRGKRSRGTRGP